VLSGIQYVASRVFTAFVFGEKVAEDTGKDEREVCRGCDSETSGEAREGMARFDHRGAGSNSTVARGRGGTSEKRHI